ncbi:hypothetical protein FOMPIDRAFT_87307 [Fomitopsis schrenkii]|uniref:Uncharacterized protein n=1 Tax=Fomitopsis schrenkii TaxID=2126942 RepID=S8EYM5_FOMSC|nr:hypothetical protein FOMPIDRAFT_87307 [Fomitopsis schrenkii]
MFPAGTVNVVPGMMIAAKTYLRAAGFEFREALQDQRAESGSRRPLQLSARQWIVSVTSFLGDEPSIARRILFTSDESVEVEENRVNAERTRHPEEVSEQKVVEPSW